MSERIWNILVEGFVKIMLASIKVTIPLTVLGFSFAMIIAMFMAMVQYAKVPVLRQLSRLYIWVFRGTPLLVQLFLAYYGFPKIGIVLNSFVCAVIVFSLNEGAYCAETMRSALEAVPEGQMEAAFPPLSNSVIAMLKDTSLVAEITVADMFMAAQKIVGRTYEPLWLYCEVALIYLFFSTILTFVQRYFEKRLSAYNSRETEVRTQE